MGNTNPDAIDFEEWAAPALNDETPTWMLRRLAVDAQHRFDDTWPITC
jgi:hypothetical protein